LRLCKQPFSGFDCPHCNHSTPERPRHKSYRSRTFSAKPGGLRPRRAENYRTSAPETDDSRHVRPTVSKGRSLWLLFPLFLSTQK
jgi:hypothetical protein